VRVGTSDLTRDGRAIVYAVRRKGTDRTELRLSDLQTGQIQVLASDDQGRYSPRWSPDGTRLAYLWFRWKDIAHTTAEAAVVIRRTQGGEEETVSRFEGFEFSRNFMVPTDWSPNGQSLLVSSDLSTPPHRSLYLLPLAAAPDAGSVATLVASDRKYNLWQASFSPNGRWIAFVADNLEEAGVATVAVMPSSGADSSHWTHLTDVHGWADKPRWSPDGKLLYYILRESSFFNVWAVQFDGDTGRPVGAPFQVTRFVDPGRRLFPNVGDSDLGVSAGRLILPVLETTGSIWMLDNVDQ
jgi:Tol biopolymer transport system component